MPGIVFTVSHTMPVLGWLRPPHYIRLRIEFVPYGKEKNLGEVRRTKGDTRLGLITQVFRGWELVGMEKLS